MKRVNIILLIFLLVLFHFQTSAENISQDEIHKLISSAISNANANELSKYFNSMVDINITGVEDSYSKNQATRILQDFFLKYPVKSYQISKDGVSNDGSKFSIGKLEAGNKTFRVFYLLKKVSGSYLIHQFQIQNEN
jgi:hypothetical protein